MKWRSVSRKRPTLRDRDSNSSRSTSATRQQQCGDGIRPRGSRDCGRLPPSWSVSSVFWKASDCRLRPAESWQVFRTPLEGHRERLAAAKTRPARAKVKVRDRVKARVARVAAARVRGPGAARVKG